MRSVLPPEPLKKLFVLFLEAKGERLEEEGQYIFRMHEEANYFYIVLAATNPSFKKNILNELDSMEIPSLQLVTCFASHNEFPYLGLILRNPTKAAKKEFHHVIEKAISEQFSVV